MGIDQRVWGIALAVSLLASVGGCSKESRETTPAASNPETNSEAVILVQVSGQGTTNPPAGMVPVRIRTDVPEACADACKRGEPLPSGCPDCEENILEIEATPAPDWLLENWSGENLLTNPRDPVARFYVDVSTNVLVRFIERPGIQSMDLLADCGDFLVELGQIQERRDLYDFPMDWGDIWVNNNQTLPKGNGIPDIAEFALLESVLKDRDFGPPCMVYHEHVWKAFQENKKRLAKDVPGLSPAGSNTFAAYLTLGSQGFKRLVGDYANQRFGIDLNMREYRTTSGFRPTDDLDQDGHSNLAEWEYVLRMARLEGKADSGLVTATDYASVAVNPALPASVP